MEPSNSSFEADVMFTVHPDTTTTIKLTEHRTSPLRKRSITITHICGPQREFIAVLALTFPDFMHGRKLTINKYWCLRFEEFDLA